MNKIESEFLWIGGAFFLAPVVACAVALPLFMVTKNALCSIVAGTVVAMAVYVAGCWLHVRNCPSEE